MSILYQVTVLELPDESSCVLDIRSVHPDAKLMECSPGFALMLLLDKAEGSPLRKMVDLTTVMDEDWAWENTLGYIQSVGLSDVGAEPPAKSKDDPDHPYWKENRYGRAKMHLRVTHPAWRSHLNQNMVWDSAAFNPVQEYEPCNPVLPGKKDIPLDIDFTASAGFLPVPAFTLDPEKLPSLKEQKEVYFLPIYGESAYEAVDKVEGEGLLASDLSPWMGSPILFSDSGRITLGTLLNVEKNTDGFHYCTSWGGGFQPIKGMDWMARAAFKKRKKNLVAETSATKLIGRDPILLSTDIKGNTATLTLIHLTAALDFSAYRKNMILGLIASPLYHSFEDKFMTRAPLALALNYELDRLGHDPFFDFEFYPAVANGYILSFNIKEPPSGMPTLDIMSGEELIAYYQKGNWPVFTITIKLSDPIWIEHLKGKKLRLERASCFDKRQPDDLEPRIWSDIKVAAMASKRNQDTSFNG